MPFAGEHEHILMQVARAAIRGTLSGQAPAPPEVDDAFHPELRQPAGCFVSLHDLETSELRGCVGRLESRDPLLVTVHDSAINVLADPRFTARPVTLPELPRLELELTVLSPLLQAMSCLDFEPETHGIYLTIAGRGGCFLPQVARDTGWSRQQLLDRLCTEKLGLPSDAWKNGDVQLFVFTAEIIGPKPLDQAPRAGIF